MLLTLLLLIPLNLVWTTQAKSINASETQIPAPREVTTPFPAAGSCQTFACLAEKLNEFPQYSNEDLQSLELPDEFSDGMNGLEVDETALKHQYANGQYNNYDDADRHQHKYDNRDHHLKKYRQLKALKKEKVEHIRRKVARVLALKRLVDSSCTIRSKKNRIGQLAKSVLLQGFNRKFGTILGSCFGPEVGRNKWLRDRCALEQFLMGNSPRN